MLCGLYTLLLTLWAWSWGMWSRKGNTDGGHVVWCLTHLTGGMWSLSVETDPTLALYHLVATKRWAPPSLSLAQFTHLWYEDDNFCFTELWRFTNLMYDNHLEQYEACGKLLITVINNDYCEVLWKWYMWSEYLWKVNYMLWIKGEKWCQEEGWCSYHQILPLLKTHTQRKLHLT